MISFLDLRAQHARLRPELDEAIGRVLDSCEFALGSEVERFESEFASFCDTREAIAVNSGTSALHLALLAAGVGEGDEVITSPSTFVATVAAIRATGARPVFVDIDRHRYTIDPNRIPAALSAHTKAIVPVHLYGQCADMAAIGEIAANQGLSVIEDACQAHGAEYRLRRAGSIGDSGCFSFYPGKNLGACGEGGIVVTNDAEQALRMRRMRDWGQKSKGDHVLPGFNYRMDGIQAAVLRVKLRYLNEWNERRAACATRYTELLADSGLVLPIAAPDGKHVWHVFAVRSRRRDALRDELARAGIATAIHYPVPVHLQPPQRDLGYRPSEFPHSERLAGEVLSLPIHPELSAADLDEVAGAILETCKPRYAELETHA